MTLRGRPVRQVRKRDGRLEPFNPKKIEVAIGKAIRAVGTANWRLAATLAGSAEARVQATWRGRIPSVEYIQDCVEQVLMQNNLPDIAKAYILYRERPSKAREVKEFFGVRDDLKLGINAIKVLERRYFMRDRGGNVRETPSKLFRRVSRTMARIEKRYGGSDRDRKRWEETWYQMMARQEFLPNTPALMNAGARLRELSACFVIPIEDSLASIFDALKAAGMIHQSGGGTGFSFSPLRPEGDLVRSTGGRASGPISFMKIFDQMTETIKQGGVRRGANMGVLRVDHPDILEFIAMKENPEAMRNFNVSVAVPDAFMRAAMRRKMYGVVNPRTGKAVKRLNAGEVFDLITSYAWKTGDPGMIFIDEINRKNPTRHLGAITSTNPCDEVPLHPWESCNLASINLAKFVKGELTRGKIEWQRLGEAVHAGVRFLDNMIDASRFPLLEITHATHANRRIGLGVMGFAEALILMGIPYDSPRALKAVAKIGSFLAREGLKASSELGRRRGSFPNFKGSLWQRRGLRAMRNANVIVIAPTGTISIIAGCSSGIEPLFAVSFVRNVMQGTRLLESNPIFEELGRSRGFWSDDLLSKVARTGSVRGIKRVPKDIQRLFVTALEIPYAAHIRMQAVWQKYTHAPVSKTINMPADASVEDVRRAYILAWKLKCKGITIYRYGSKAGQVLTIGPLEKDIGNQHVTVESEFSGGCPAGVCATS